MKKIKSLILTAAAGLALAFSARAEINLIDSRPMTNMANLTIAGGAASSLTGSVIELRKNTGLAFIPLFRATNDTTAAVTFSLYVSNDATNWTTTSLDYNATLNGTNWVRGFKFWSPEILGGVRYAAIRKIQNGHTNSITVSNASYSRFN